MKIVLWRLGSLEHRIFPTREGIQNFTNILANALEKDLHIVWGPDIDVKMVDVEDLDFDPERFDLRAILKENQVHIIESVKSE